MTQGGRAIRVVSSKYDGSWHNEFVAEYLDDAGGVLRLVAPMGTVVRTSGGEYRTHSAATWLFWPGADCWWNVSHFHEPQVPDGRVVFSYANVSLPSMFDGEAVRWVDLDLDVMVTGDGAVLLDEDEFEERRVSLGYPAEVAARARAAAGELMALASVGAAPFDWARHVLGR